MTFAAFLVVICCFFGASLSGQSFTAEFTVTYSQYTGGYFEGYIYYDWNQNAFDLQFPLVGLYNELYIFNTPRGFDTSLVNGQFFAQYLYKNSDSCSCETSTLSYVMPPLFQASVSYNSQTVNFWTSLTTTVNVNSLTCNQYVPNSLFSETSLITSYLETADGVPCGFTLFDGRTFTFTSILSTSEPPASHFTPPTGCKCGKPIDIVFSVDRSGSIQYWEFLVEHAFVLNLTEQFEFGPQATNMGILNWNYNRWTQISLVNGNNFANVYAAALAMDCSSPNPAPTDSCTCCGTPIGGALWDAGREMLTSTRKATKIIILITDGCQNHLFSPPDNVTSCPNCETEVECGQVAICSEDITTHYNQVIQNIPGVTVLSIGVGGDNQICPPELLLIAGGIQANVWNPTSWAELASFVQVIAATACAASANPCTENCCGICSCGSCIKPLNCTAPDDCTQAYIDPVTGCCATKPLICPTLPCQNVVCNPVGGCTYTQRVCTPPNKCVNSSCNNVTNNCQNIKNGLCTVIPPECTEDSACADGRLCYDHSCINQTCYYTEKSCVSNACVQSVCNPTYGNCSASYTNCDDLNACTADSCDPVKGCINAPITCSASSDLCNIPECSPLTGCYFNRVNCSMYISTNCTIWACKNGTCSNVTVCVVVPPTAGTEINLLYAEAVGGAIGAAAIAGIVIAIIIAVVIAAGSGAYAYSAGGGAGPAPADRKSVV